MSVPPLLAMHMANELLSVPVAGLTLAIAAALVAVAAHRARRAVAGDRLPLMGVMCAFVFSAHMINFTLPGMPAPAAIWAAAYCWRSCWDPPPASSPWPRS